MSGPRDNGPVDWEEEEDDWRPGPWPPVTDRLVRPALRSGRQRPGGDAVEPRPAGSPAGRTGAGPGLPGGGTAGGCRRMRPAPTPIPRRARVDIVGFDSSETAIRLAEHRAPGSSVRYVSADLLDPRAVVVSLRPRGRDGHRQANPASGRATGGALLGWRLATCEVWAGRLRVGGREVGDRHLGMPRGSVLPPATGR
jgi:hypothetical protein